MDQIKTSLTTTISSTVQVSIIENYYNRLDKKLRKKYNLVIERLTDPEEKKDALVLFEGDEGSGKTNHSMAFAKIIAEATGRTINNTCVRFLAGEMIEEAKSSKNKIFIYDEPALESLKSIIWSDVKLQLTQLLLMARKNGHLFIFNIADYAKFNEYIIRRAICMVRVYKRKENDKQRRFLYYPRKKLRLMYEKFLSCRKRNYFKYYTLRGTMPNLYILPLVINEDIYEADKDNAIARIGVKKKQVERESDRKLKHLQYCVYRLLKDKGISQTEFSKLSNIGQKTISDWGIREIDNTTSQPI